MLSPRLGWVGGEESQLYWAYENAHGGMTILPIQKIHAKEICFTHKTKHYLIQIIYNYKIAENLYQTVRSTLLHLWITKSQKHQ